jgi:hypothetical protein
MRHRVARPDRRNEAEFSNRAAFGAARGLPLGPGWKGDPHPPFFQ